MTIYENVSKECGLFDRVVSIMLPNTPKDKILIYDIDTTSFEAANGCVFLIGTMFFKDGALCTRQFFSKNITEEAVIIEKFIELAEQYECLLSYKGESFDIPYMVKRLFNLQRKDLFKRLDALRSRSMDLFNDISPLKPLLDFSSTKLDYLRKKLGQTVPERISGENISKFYVEHISAAKLKALLKISKAPENYGFIPDYVPKQVADELAHITPDSGDRFLNEILLRNIENMESVLYLGRLAHLFNMRKGLYEVSAKANGIPENGIVINFDIDYRDNTYAFILSPISLNLKQFFINYRDYYYFPAEDMAMHKSVAEFSDKASRKKATPQTAYTKVSGNFVKVSHAYIKSLNQKEGCLYKDRFESTNYYLPVKNILNMNLEALKEFAFFSAIDHLKDKLDEILL